MPDSKPTGGYGGQAWRRSRPRDFLVGIVFGASVAFAGITVAIVADAWRSLQVSCLDAQR